MDNRRKIIKDLFYKYDGIYGARKIKKLLEDNGIFISVKTVSNDLKFLGLASCYVKKYKPKKSSLSNDENCINHLKDIEEMKPRTFVATDITYIKTINDGWIYQLTFMDLFSRKILHFDVSKKMDSDFVDSNLKILLKKCPTISLIHSDRGSQFTSHSYRSILSEKGITASYSAKGYPYDNAFIESYHASLKVEKIYRCRILDLAHAKKIIFEYNYAFYNSKRIHQSLGFISPNDFEKNFFKLSLVG